jgi:hypothetical protein
MPNILLTYKTNALKQCKPRIVWSNIKKQEMLTSKQHIH